MGVEEFWHELRGFVYGLGSGRFCVSQDPASADGGQRGQFSDGVDVGGRIAGAGSGVDLVHPDEAHLNNGRDKLIRALEAAAVMTMPA